MDPFRQTNLYQITDGQMSKYMLLTSLIIYSIKYNILQWGGRVIQVDLTPNRSDCLGIIGLARETGLMNNLDVCMPDIQPVAAVHDDQVAVHLADLDGCPRFVGRVVRDVDLTAATPLWLAEKLRSARNAKQFSAEQEAELQALQQADNDDRAAARIAEAEEPPNPMARGSQRRRRAGSTRTC